MDESLILYPCNKKWNIKFEAYEKYSQYLRNDQIQAKYANQAANNHSTRPKVHPKKQ
jgi:hypothetical protein